MFQLRSCLVWTSLPRARHCSSWRKTIKIPIFFLITRLSRTCNQRFSMVTCNHRKPLPDIRVSTLWFPVEDLDDTDTPDVHFREDETMFLYCEEDQMQNTPVTQYFRQLSGPRPDCEIVRILTMFLPSFQVQCINDTKPRRIRSTSTTYSPTETRKCGHTLFLMEVSQSLMDTDDVSGSSRSFKKPCYRRKNI